MRVGLQAPIPACTIFPNSSTFNILNFHLRFCLKKGFHWIRWSLNSLSCYKFCGSMVLLAILKRCTTQHLYSHYWLPRPKTRASRWQTDSWWVAIRELLVTPQEGLEILLISWRGWKDLLHSAVYLMCLETAAYFPVWAWAYWLPFNSWIKSKFLWLTFKACHNWSLIKSCTAVQNIPGLLQLYPFTGPQYSTCILYRVTLHALSTILKCSFPPLLVFVNHIHALRPISNTYLS